MSGAERRELIRQVAQDLFIRNGYATTTADVATRADVSPALVVKYFGTKEALFREAVAEPLIEQLERFVGAHRRRLVDDEVANPTGYLEMLTEFGEGLVRLVRAQQPLILAMVRESVDFPDVAAELLAIARGLIDDLAADLGRFVDNGDFVDFDPRLQITMGIGSLVMGALVTDDVAEVVQAHYRSVLFGLLSEEARDRARP